MGDWNKSNMEICLKSIGLVKIIIPPKGYLFFLKNKLSFCLFINPFSIYPKTSLIREELKSKLYTILFKNCVSTIKVVR